MEKMEFIVIGQEGSNTCKDEKLVEALTEKGVDIDVLGYELTDEGLALVEFDDDGTEVDVEMFDGETFDKDAEGFIVMTESDVKVTHDEEAMKAAVEADADAYVIGFVYEDGKVYFYEFDEEDAEKTYDLTNLTKAKADKLV